MDLSPRSAKTLMEGDGGSYQAWLSSEYPILEDEKLGAGKLLLKPLGFALPHYADSSKIGYVLQGEGLAGVLLPKTPKEKIVNLKKGDLIVIPCGTTSWWYNDGDADLSIVFIGDTSTANSPGNISYFFLAGSLGIFQGFSTELITKSLNIDESEAKKLFGSQSGTLIIKLKEKIQGLVPCDAVAEGIILNHDGIKFDVEGGVGTAVVTKASLLLLKEVGFSVNLVEIEPNSVLHPGFNAEPVVQMVFVAKGSGRVEMVGSDGKSSLDTVVDQGFLFVVPKFFVMSAIAGTEGMKWVSITMSQEPVYKYLAGKESVFKELSPQILGVSLNVSADLVQLLSANPQS